MRRGGKQACPFPYNGTANLANRPRAKEAHPGHDGHNQPDQADNGHINVKELSESQADAGDFTSNAWPHQAFACQDCAHTSAAVGTKVSVILNYLATVVAIHIHLAKVLYETEGLRVPCYPVNC